MQIIIEKVNQMNSFNMISSIYVGTFSYDNFYYYARSQALSNKSFFVNSVRTRFGNMLGDNLMHIDENSTNFGLEKGLEMLKTHEKNPEMLVPGPNDSNFSGLAMNIGLYGWVYMRCNHSTSLEQNYLQKNT